ncbi:MAG: L,D-transpeptidase [Kofleriaceae bacterium]
MRLLLLFVAGCAGSSPAPQPIPDSTVAIRVDQVERVEPIVRVEPVERAPLASPYGKAIRSVRFRTTTALRARPALDAAKLGVIRKGTRAVATSAAPASAGCRSRWIQIAPRGWACESVVIPTRDAPTEAVASDAAERPVRGIYGVVRGKEVQAYANAAEAKAGTGRMLTGNNSVRAAGTVTIEGRRYWRTSQGALIDAKSIATFSPSKFEGVAIESSTTLPAWLRSRRDPYEPITTYSAAGAVSGTLPRRMVVTILEEVDARVRVTNNAWVARTDVRIATVAPPPPGTKPDERWFDIDLDEQVLVAYEGKRAVFATLVSTGKYRHHTPTVITRITAKHERAHMTGDGEDVCSVADVPWTMYYDGNYALHTSYWHDSFGGPRSHGCINLAPRDARRLYHWSSPDVPPGWSSVYGDAEHPGSLVRVGRVATGPSFRGCTRAARPRRHRRGNAVVQEDRSPWPAVQAGASS